MNMLGLKKFMAVAVLAAAFGAGGIQPAGAIVFIFNGVCNNTNTCNASGGVGVGTAVTGTLVLEDSVSHTLDLTTPGSIYVDNIVSFSLVFTPEQSGLGVTNPFNFVPGFKLTNPSDDPNTVPVGKFKFNVGNVLAIDNIAFLDSDTRFDTTTMTDVAAPNRFTYQDQENSVGWTLRSLEPNVRGAGCKLDNGQPCEPQFDITFTEQAKIPEPSSLAGFLLGSIGLLAFARRRASRKR